MRRARPGCGSGPVLPVYFNRLAVTNLFLDVSIVVMLVFLLVLILRYAMLLWFAYLQHLQAIEEPLQPDRFPFISVVIPAYNEAVVIGSSVRSVMEQDYPAFEALIVDDGSTNDTYKRATELARLYGRDRIRVLTQRNAWKAAALNRGIAQARGEMVLCMDGDSRLEPQVLRQAVKHFNDPLVGAVAGNVKVANRLNLLTRLQALEYVEGLNLVRTAQAFFRKVTVIPGPVGLFRKSVLQIGGYRRDTYAEDCELTLRVFLSGWKIKYESRAVAWTEAPETTQALFKQRYRWSRGILQAVLKHKRELLRPYPNFVNWAFLWLLVVESIAMPGMNLFGILFFTFAAIWGGLSYLIVLWWAQLTILDMVVALFCVAMEEEDLRLALHAFLYRLFFVPYVDVMRFFAALDEMFGVQMAWGRLQRVGRI